MRLYCAYDEPLYAAGNQFVTVPLLFTYISLALLLQLVVGIGVGLWRRRSGPGEQRAMTEVPVPVASTGAWPGWRDFRVVRRAFEDRAQTQCSFYLEPIDGGTLPSFKPGQFLTFQVQLPGVDGAAQGAGRTITRCYSLSDRPGLENYRITVKRAPAPAGQTDWPPGLSSNHLHDRVHEGDVLRVKAPSGHFHIDPESRLPVVLIAGGIGITPMMSMLRWVLAEQPGREIHLFYGVRHGGEQVFREQLDLLAASHAGFHRHVVFSRPALDDLSGRDFQHTGHVDIDLLRRVLPHGRHQFYVCGSAALMESLVPALAAWGVAVGDIHFEAFGPSSVRLADPGGISIPQHLDLPVEVHFHRSGRTLAWDGQDNNLLDFAERHGVEVDSGCRSGGCGSCETKLVSGTVRYASKPDHDVAPGHCLLCVASPESALTLEA